MTAEQRRTFMQIIYWSDYACPFCYIGEGFLKQAIAKLDTNEKFEFVMKARL